MFMDDFIVLHEYGGLLNPLIIRIDKIKVIHKVKYDNDDVEHCNIYFDNHVLSVNESFETVLRRLQRGNN